jgi:antitoxin YefM
VEIINYTEARKTLAPIMDRVVESQQPIAITRKNAKPVVMVSLDEYNSWQETLYLLKAQKSQKRLLESARAIKQGKFAVKELIDDKK